MPYPDRLIYMYMGTEMPCGRIVSSTITVTYLTRPQLTCFAKGRGARRWRVPFYYVDLGERVEEKRKPTQFASAAALLAPG
ncbi:hypothetical protein M0657_000683 [Pyricularia oryzae]|nr:hypothetical protein MCOR23_005820 [Pyricularia oryzae]KAI6415338.1 hypothetical protein MCOR20_001670 [Pyricularia oryzae]KAI6560301.1 hypothetical protein MCOR03_004418 [Pyricularia oryzae]KAI7927479.1 hypothetical protein M9X92_002202 [Pyricularia oryzae]KAI7932244.1 hypothetical protein M0657_000683 [Pyricularia oryzae]